MVKFKKRLSVFRILKSHWYVIFMVGLEPYPHALRERTLTFFKVRPHSYVTLLEYLNNKNK